MSNSQKKPREKLELLFQPYESSLDYDLVRFIKHHSYYSSKEIALSALKAFWLPLAARSSNRYNPSEILEITLHSLYILKKQLDFLSIEMNCCLGEPIGLTTEHQPPKKSVGQLNTDSSKISENLDEDEIWDFSNSGTEYSQQGLW
ncbi:hypothetical protein PCC7424_5579 (plasmid) [Gloeothece citriformis PCC 7424]|uniref:Uncharacterized protein n=1 Tax=Gloeothece citriformis (strain PCC 7424) TaxID=65393 RepID=B7KMX0_GLOC7|nr:hypothetical protein [Gloeothece citriformis]ACK74142.1 hypothetical protein PCC7424_5579 [Gloeothece citriformis PCC 7424]